jgi:hypothetical protein
MISKRTTKPNLVMSTYESYNNDNTKEQMFYLPFIGFFLLLFIIYTNIVLS